MEWYQCLTIIGSMFAMMMWASRERRTDNLFTLKLIDEIRKDIVNFNTKLALQDQEFKMRLADIEEGKKKR